MNIHNFYNNKILIVDLASGICNEEELGEDIVKNWLGGTGINIALYERFVNKDPIIIGSGLFTGSFVPASCAGVVTAKNPLNGSLSHIPLTWYFTPELKLSGFDYIVIIGESQNPVRLWLHDGLSEILNASQLWGKDTWETIDFLKQDHGDDLIQTLSIGPIGEKAHPLSSISENYWGSMDKSGIGAVFGRKKLKAIAVRGLGSFSIRDGFFERCVDLKNKIVNNSLKDKKGFGPIISALELNQDIFKSLDEKTHRYNACFNCPYPCYQFIMIDENPKILKLSEKEEPGCLARDILALSHLDFLGVNGIKVLIKCLKIGIEPASCAMILNKYSIKNLEDAIKKLNEISSSPVDLTKEDIPNFYNIAPWIKPEGLESKLVQSFGVFSSAIPPKIFYSTYENPSEEAKNWILKQSIAYILGICPILINITPEMNESNLADLIKTGLESDDIKTEDLLSIAKNTIHKSISLSKPTGTIHKSLMSNELETALNRLLETIR